MIKKTLLALTILATTSQADTKLHFGLFASDTYNGYIFTSSANFNPGKDWMGIYKKGTSTAWSNVIDWKWVKDLGCGADNQPCHNEYHVPINLPKGDYTMRYFKNNSFIVDGSLDFKVEVETKGTNLDKIMINVWNNEETKVTLCNDSDTLRVGSKDWVGVYKKDASNAWGNVIDWAWAKDFRLSGVSEYTCGDRLFKNLPDNTTYEVRYFKNNTYTTYKKSKPFKIENTHAPIQSIEAYNGSPYTQDNKEKLTTVLLSSSWEDPSLHIGKKDWVGVYEKGASSAWKNVKAWAWAKDFTVAIPADIVVKGYVFKNLPPHKTYEIRYFKNNSYTIYKKTTIKK